MGAYIMLSDLVVICPLEGMKTKEIVNGFANSGVKDAIGELEIRVEHGVDDVIAKDEGDELGGGFVVERGADSAGAEVVGEEFAAALHADLPQLTGEGWEVVSFGDEDAVEGKELWFGKHAQHHAADIKQSLLRRHVRLNVFDVLREQRNGVGADDGYEEIGFGGVDGVKSLLGSACAASDFAGGGSCIAAFEEDRGGRGEDACAIGGGKGWPSAGGVCGFAGRIELGLLAHYSTGWY